SVADLVRQTGSPPEAAYRWRAGRTAATWRGPPAASTERTERRPGADSSMTRPMEDPSPLHLTPLGASRRRACFRSPPPRDRRGDDSEQRTEHDGVPHPERESDAGL